MKLSCRECGAKLNIKEIEEAKDTCPVCKKEMSWFSDVFYYIRRRIPNLLRLG